jgi:cytochrome c556
MAFRNMTVALALVAGLGVAATGAIAQTAVANAVKVRHENFKAQGAAFKAINDEIKKDAPSLAVITPNAIKLKASSTALPTWFPKGSGPESKLETDAKQAAATRFQGEAAKLAAVATAGDMAAVKAQTRATGGACKNCHDTYRVPKKD